MVYVESTANTSASTHNNTGGQVCTLHHYTHHRRGAKQAQSRSSLNPTEVSRKDNGQHLQSALKEKSLERDKRDPLFLGFRSHLKTIQTCEHLHPSERLWARRAWLGMPWWARGFAVWSFSSCVCVGVEELLTCPDRIYMFVSTAESAFVFSIPSAEVLLWCVSGTRFLSSNTN